MRLTNLGQALGKLGVFGRGAWRYWRLGEPEPESNWFVQKLYAYTDGRSNDILFRILESRRKETDLRVGWNGACILNDAGNLDPSIEEIARTLKKDGVVLLPRRLKEEAVQNLREFAQSSSLDTTTYGVLASDAVAGNYSTVPVAETGKSNGIDPSQPRHSVYAVPRSLLLENHYIQSLLCDPYILAVAARYLGVFPIVTKPDMWWIRFPAHWRTALRKPSRSCTGMERKKLVHRWGAHSRAF